MTIRCTVFVGTSVDGFIAREDGRFDFLPETVEDHGYNELIASIDAHVIGRKTFETVLGFGGWAYGKKPVFVLTTDAAALKAPDEAVCEFMTGEPQEIVQRLESRGFQHLYVDGGDTVHRFMRAGLIDRIVQTRVPVLIGSGIPLFGTLPHDVRLEHVSTRTFKSGLVQSEYAVKKDA